jgi:hypothetical protein
MKSVLHLQVLLHISLLFWTSNQILVHSVQQHIMCCWLRATGTSPVCGNLRQACTCSCTFPYSALLLRRRDVKCHCHCDTNPHVCRAAARRAVSFAAVLVWNYCCDHFVFVAAITDSAPHDVNKITGRGQLTWFLIIPRREVQDFWKTAIQGIKLKGIKTRKSTMAMPYMRIVNTGQEE